MKPMSLVHRCLSIAVFATVLVAPARAGRLVTSGLDDSLACAGVGVGAAVSRAVAPRRAELRLSTQAGTPASAPEPAHDRRARGKATPGVTLKPNRPSTQRSKTILTRETHAAPGMGLLLRLSVSAGREISWRADEAPATPYDPEPCRGPPVAAAASLLAPTSPSDDPPSTAALAYCRPRRRSPRRPQSRSADRPEGRKFACAHRRRIGLPLVSPMERRRRSRDGRLEGRAACTSRPSGGFTS